MSSGTSASATVGLVVVLAQLVQRLARVVGYCRLQPLLARWRRRRGALLADSRQLLRLAGALVHGEQAIGQLDRGHAIGGQRGAAGDMADRVFIRLVVAGEGQEVGVVLLGRLARGDLLPQRIEALFGGEIELLALQVDAGGLLRHGCLALGAHARAGLAGQLLGGGGFLEEVARFGAGVAGRGAGALGGGSRLRRAHAAEVGPEDLVATRVDARHPLPAGFLEGVDAAAVGVGAGDLLADRRIAPGEALLLVHLLAGDHRSVARLHFRRCGRIAAGAQRVEIGLGVLLGAAEARRRADHSAQRGRRVAAPFHAEAAFAADHRAGVRRALDAAGRVAAPGHAEAPFAAAAVAGQRPGRLVAGDPDARGRRGADGDRWGAGRAGVEILERAGEPGPVRCRSLRDRSA